MSTTIDQRVVEMRFDNKQFEAGVSTTMSTLEKLKQKLKLTEAAKGLEDVSAAARKCDVSAVGEAAEKVGLKFNAMYTIADQALRNITNSAMMYGKRIISALTIDPVKMGFSEYETQMNAVQTILANTESKGKTLEDVNTALDELNTYADKTIYNFTEMTRNIGTFTAAGVDLDTSVSAIKGIANLAAVSGSTSQQASTAMYQLSQAMASGTVKLMDWNSVVNAGMGGQVFQDALKETAKVHGIAIDDIIKKNGSFRESLSEGWLTTEILTDTLAKFTGDLSEEQLKSKGYTEQQIKEIMKLGQTANDAATKVKTFSQLFDTLKEAAQSGWTQTWEILVGDFEEAKALLTQISDVIGGMIGKSAESRNEMLENWKVLGGRDDVIESFKNIFEALGSVITPIKEAFREIFPPMTAERLADITEGIKNFTARLKLSDDTSDNLKRTFKGLFAVMKVFTKIISAVFKAIGILFDGVGKLGGGFLEVTGSIGDFLVYFSELITSSNIIEGIFTGVAKVFNFLIKVVAGLVKGIGKLIGIIGNGFVFPGISVLVNGLKDIYNGMFDVGESAGSMREAVSNAFGAMGDKLRNSFIFKFFSTIWSGIKRVGSAIGQALGNIFGGLLDRIANADLMGIIEIINGLISGGLGVALMRFINSLRSSFDATNDIVDGINDVLGSVSGALKGFQNSLNAEAIKKIAVAIAILAGAVLVLSFIDSEKLADAMAAITILFGGVMGEMMMLTRFSDVTGIAKVGTTMITFSIGILFLASALKKISKLSMDEIIRGLIGVGGLMAALTIAMKAMQTVSIKDDGFQITGVVKGAMQMVIVALAAKILAGVLKDIAKLDWEELAIGTLGMFAVVGALVGAMKILPLGTKNIAKPFFKFCAQIIIVAKAADILADALIDLAYLDWDELGVGVVALTGVMGLLVGAMKILGTIGDYSKKTKGLDISKNLKFGGLAIAMLALAAAVKILVPVIEELGNMDWKVLGKAGIVFAALLAGMAIFSLTLKMVKSDVISSAGKSILLMAVSLRILAGAFKVFGGMSWESLAKSGVVLAAITGLLVVLGAMSQLTNRSVLDQSFAKSIISITGSMMILAVALDMLIPPLLIFSLMSWEMLAKAGAALGGIMLALAGLGTVSQFVSPGSMAVLASSLIILAIALQMLTVPLMMIGLMSWGTLAKGLLVLAVAFGVLGTAGVLLAPMAVTIVILAGALALLGAGVFLIGAGIGILGAGLVLLGAGLTAFGASLVALCEFIPMMIAAFAKGIAQAIIEVCGIVADGAPAVGRALISVIATLCDVIVESIPKIVTTVLELVVALLDALVKYAPKIVDSIAKLLVGILQSLAKYVPSLVDALFDIIIGLLEGIANRIPDLIQAVVDIFAAVFKGAAEALRNMDPNELLSGVAALTLLAIMMKALASVAGMIPAAMTGAVGLGIVIAELAVILGILGGFAQIPGLTWIIGEGGKVLEAIGTAIGQFIGGLAGGIVKGFTSSLPEIGNDLSRFMTNLQPFIEGAKNIDQDAVAGAMSLVKVILAITGASILEGIASWLNGGSSIATFAEEIVALGHGLKGFSDATAGIDPENVVAASDAAKALAEMTRTIPNEGGVVSWFVGDNSIAKFAGEIVALGYGLKGFADATAGIDPETIVAASGAAKALAEMTNYIPNSGGVVSWFAGDNSVSKFAGELPLLGAGLKGFYDGVAGVNPEAITAAANAAVTLADMTTHIPNSGGMKSWFTGDNSVAKFSGQLIMLGQGLSGFSSALVGVSPETIMAGANAGKHLVDLVANLPDQGGMVAWFTGDQSAAKFAFELPALGQGLKGFSDEVAGINPESVSAAASAGKILAEMTNHIPNSGGMVAWFTGEQSASKFGGELPALGRGLKGFNDEVTGINPETVTAAANAAKTLAEMTNHIPNSGGMVSWFTGEASVSKFSGDLRSLGEGMKSFSDATTGVSPDSMIAASDAAKTLAEMTTHIPNEGGVKSWFAGEVSVSKFAGDLKSLGDGLKGFSDSTSGINPENVTAAAGAAKSLAEMTTHIPKEGGIKAWFTGETNVANFAEKLPTLGKGLKGFSDSVAGINPENVVAASNAAKSLAQMTESVPGETDKIITFGDNLAKFGTKLASYFNNTKSITTESTSASANAINAVKEIINIDSGKINAVGDSINKVSDSIRNLAKVPGDSLSTFVSSFENLGKQGVKAFTKEFEGLEGDLKKLAKKAIDAFIDGINDKKKKAVSACTKLAEACAEAVEDKDKSFENAGKALAQGLADGISANSYKAEAKAKAMAEAAAEAARKALDINSPSKVFRALGYSIPEGLAVGIDKLSGTASDSAADMANNSINVVKRTVSRISDYLSSDMDAQPTIRPVLDLSDVKSGARTISGLFGTGASVGVMANIGAINSMMSKQNQNGANDDVVDEIIKLRKELADSDHATYNINGINVTGDESVEEAFRTILRAAKIERRR